MAPPPSSATPWPPRWPGTRALRCCSWTRPTALRATYGDCLRRSPASPSATRCPLTAALGPTSLGAIESLRASFAHVLVRVLPSGAAVVPSSRRLLLTSVSTTVDDAGCDYRIVAWDRSARPGVRAGVVRVASPTRDERVSISAGALSGRGPAGRTLGWIARDIAGLKVGLALGSGSVRGFAHIGVLRALERTGVPVDFLAGSSIGAPVAGMLAAGDDPDVILDKLRRVGTATFRPTVPRARDLVQPAGSRRHA